MKKPTQRKHDLAHLDMGATMVEAEENKAGNTQRHSVLIFTVLCLFVGGLPLCVTSQLFNGIELPKLALLFIGTGVLVSIRLFKNG